MTISKEDLKKLVCEQHAEIEILRHLLKSALQDIGRLQTKATRT